MAAPEDFTCLGVGNVITSHVRKGMISLKRFGYKQLGVEKLVISSL